MTEKFDPKNIETDREKLIKARATLDAFEYINLMREKLPEKLEFQPDGEVMIDTIEGGIILGDARKALDLTPEEMMKYFVDLGTEVKEILLRKN